MKGIKEWSESWSLWFRSPTFIPGLALALLFTNVFQLSYIAQGYITLHCISDVFMGMLIYAEDHNLLRNLVQSMLKTF